MTWTKLSDDFTDDCWTLSDAAVRLHIDGLIWSNRKLLDNRIPAEDVPRISKGADAVKELQDVGWWTYDEDDGVFVIRHHAIYQRSREQVISIQERNQRNGAKGGRPPKPGRERVPETQVDTQMGSHLETHRDGTGRDGSGKARLEEELRATPICFECQRRAAFNSGPCPDHREQVAR